MDVRTDFIYRGSVAPQEPVRYVTGQYLAKNGLKPRAKARLAKAIKDERVKIRDLTVSQLARLCRVSVPYVADALKPPARSESLAEHFARSTAEEWRECARTIGPAKIWDHMIAPLV